MQRTNHEWSKDALYAKAIRYAEEMLEHDHTEWQFGLWSALTLEMLARATLARVHPTLIADCKDWNNILYALGLEPNQGRYTPRSVEISEVLKRLEILEATFTREQLNFSITHTNRRNSELHSGGLPFDGLGSSNWIPMFYEVCETLLNLLETSMPEFFGTETAEEAQAHIQILKDDTAKSVKGTINAHATIWKEKSEEERETLVKQAEAHAVRSYGHRVACPACQSNAIVRGTLVGPPRKSIDEEGIAERTTMLPATFQCTACDLKISGYSKLVACGLGDTFVSTSIYDAVEYFDVDIEEHFRGMMEEDNNEPY